VAAELSAEPQQRSSCLQNATAGISKALLKEGLVVRDEDERLRQAIRVGNIGIFEHDHNTDLIFWSLELRQLYGWDPDEPATLRKILSHVHPDDADRVVAAVMRAHNPEGDGTFDIEHRIVDRRGELRWLLTRSQTHFGSVLGNRRALRTIGAVQDVTHRRHAEERLRVLDTVLSSSAQAIAVADSLGTLTFANAAVRRLWRYPDREELLGRSLFELWKTDDDPAVALERIREHRVQKLDMPASRADGTRFYLGITAEAVCDANGALTQVLVTFSDVTDRKRLEDQLIQAQKMESIGRLAGGIAHDFNNLLTIISAGLDFAVAPLPPDHPSRTELAEVADAAQSAAALTRHLLAFSRKEIIAPKVLELNEVIHRTQKMIRRLVGDDIEVQTICGEAIKLICFDPGQVEQILINLAANARDAMPDGGRLTIETSNVWLSDDYATRHFDARSGAHVLLAVSDDGVGMSDEERAHLFEPFFTTKERGKGTGLGLAMVYGAVQQNGGRIEVYSELGQGTTFKIYLPVVEGEPQQASEPPMVASGTRSATIVLVEDNPRVCRLANQALTSLGHHVRAFASGADALQALPSLSPVPELLITDVVMPGMNGRVLAERVAALLPNIRVLFVSGYTENVIVNRGVLKHGIEFLAKPYSVEQLARRVREVLEGVGIRQ
jgi:two-component system cell cycle sensor histidine kinase/response regulator CckA